MSWVAVIGALLILCVLNWGSNEMLTFFPDWIFRHLQQIPGWIVGGGAIALLVWTLAED
jgi:hypothetical protein